MTDYASVTGSTPRTRRRPRLPRGMRRVGWMFGAWSGVVFLFLYIPIAVLILWSFNSADYSTQWQGFTTKWYSAFWYRSMLDLRNAIGPADHGARHALAGVVDYLGAANAENALRNIPSQVRGQIPQFTAGLINSLFIGVIATAVSVALGTIGAWTTFKYKYPLHSLLNTLVAIPMIVPEIIMGVSLLSFITIASGLLGRVGIAFDRGYLTVIIAHVTFCFPYVMVTIQARLAGIDPALEEAAMDLGATPAQAFGRVILPYLMPAILGGMLMAFTLSLDDFIVTYFVCDGSSETLPIRIYGAVKGRPPMLHVVSTLLIGVTVFTVALSEGIKRIYR